MLAPMRSTPSHDLHDTSAQLGVGESLNQPNPLSASTHKGCAHLT